MYVTMSFSGFERVPSWYQYKQLDFLILGADIDINKSKYIFSFGVIWKR